MYDLPADSVGLRLARITRDERLILCEAVRLWVKETWNVFALSQDGEFSWPLPEIPKSDPRRDEIRHHVVVDHPVCHVGGMDGGKGPWRSFRFMPRWASRLTLHVTATKVEPLQAISEADARAEGIPAHVVEHTFIKCYRDPDERAAKRIEYFGDLWKRLHGPDSWEANPPVVAVSFRPVARNIDAMEDEHG